MRQYEFILVVQPTLEDEALNGIVAQFEGMIEGAGGEILTRGQLADKKGNITEVGDSWSKRRLAYSIKTHREGFYAALVFRGPSTVVPEMEQTARLNEDILRYLTIRVDE